MIAIKWYLHNLKRHNTCHSSLYFSFAQCFTLASMLTSQQLYSPIAVWTFEVFDLCTTQLNGSNVARCFLRALGSDVHQLPRMRVVIV